MLILKGKYSGQKLTKEVKTNAMAIMPNMIAVVPEITLLKNKTAITIAKIMRIVLSRVPMFFIIFLNFRRLRTHFFSAMDAMRKLHRIHIGSFYFF